jgi:hypothetical protein
MAVAEMTRKRSGEQKLIRKEVGSLARLTLLVGDAEIVSFRMNALVKLCLSSGDIQMQRDIEGIDWHAIFTLLESEIGEIQRQVEEMSSEIMTLSA